MVILRKGACILATALHTHIARLSSAAHTLLCFWCVCANTQFQQNSLLATRSLRSRHNSHAPLPQFTCAATHRNAASVRRSAPICGPALAQGMRTTIVGSEGYVRAGHARARTALGRSEHVARAADRTHTHTRAHTWILVLILSL